MILVGLGTKLRPSITTILHSQIRFKTFRKTDSKLMKKMVAKEQYRLAAGLPLAPRKRNVMENKFWKVVDGMKVYKSVSPGLTNRKHPVRFHLYKGSAIRRLSAGKRSTGGRNCSGRVTVRHRGGGHKKRIRSVDFYRATPGAYQVRNFFLILTKKVLRFEYDPNRTGELMLLRNMSTNEFSYIIRPAGVPIGSRIYSFPKGIPAPAPGESPLPKTTLVQPGNCLQIKVCDYL